MAESNIESQLNEQRVFKPSPEFSASAHIRSLAEYEAISKAALENPEKFWEDIASELHWFKKWHTVLEWNSPFSKWFIGGKTNIVIEEQRNLTQAQTDEIAALVNYAKAIVDYNHAVGVTLKKNNIVLDKD